MTIRQGSLLFVGLLFASVAFGSTMLLLHPAQDMPIGWQYNAPISTIEPPDPPEPEFAVAERPNPGQWQAYDELVHALDVGDSALVHFDIERLAEMMMKEDEGLVRGPVNDRTRELLVRDAPAILKTMLEPIACLEGRLSSVHWVVPQREVTFITMYGPEAQTNYRVLSLRWSMHFDGERWRLYDVENLMVGGRLSHFLAASRRSPNATPIGPQLAEVMMMVYRMNRIQARKMLDRPNLEQLPLADRALADLWRGIMSFEERFYEQAIGHLQRAISRNSQLVVGHRWLADAHFYDRQYPESRNSARRYADAIPNDHTGYEKIGWAMLQISEHSLAIEHYRRALTENPDSQDAYNGLRYALPPEQLPELGQRFRRCAKAKDILPSLVSNALRDDRPDYDGATMLVTSFFQKHPNHPEGFMQAAVISLHRKDLPQAFATFRRGLAALPPTEDHENYAARFLPRLTKDMKPVEVYLGLADRDRDICFRVLADDLIDDNDLADQDEAEPLTALMRAHRSHRPNDPWLDYYQAEVLIAQRKNHQAEQLLANRMKQPLPAETHERFWSLRLSNFAGQKQYLRAYEVLEPKRKVFRQITNWFYAPDAIQQREQVIQAHAQADPTDPVLPYWQADIHYNKDEFAQALALLERFQREGGSDYQLHERTAIERSIRCLVRLNRLPEANKLAVNPLLEYNVTLHFLLAAAGKNVKAAERMLDERANQDYWRRSILQDRDVQHYYNQPIFDALRTKYPIPKKEAMKDEE